MRRMHAPCTRYLLAGAPLRKPRRKMHIVLLPAVPHFERLLGSLPSIAEWRRMVGRTLLVAFGQFVRGTLGAAVGSLALGDLKRG